jgi:hypothetical protein
MKAEELMIGDWVYITDHPMIKEAKQVKSEHFLRSLVIFEPIPLTEEILEKNGFKKNKFNQYVLGKSYLGEKIYYEIGFEIGFIQLCYPLRYPNSYYSILSCGYVHEFQHMLKIFGIEKKIIL